MHSLISLGGDIDFIVSLVNGIGWVGLVIAWLLSAPAWFELAVIVAGLGLIFWDNRRQATRSISAKPTLALDGPIERPRLAVESASSVDARFAFIAIDHHKLVEDLRTRNNGSANVHILFAAEPHRPLAFKLKGVFELAGWTVNIPNVALEKYLHKFFSGIEVTGFNEAHLQSVAGCLKEAGLPVTTIDVSVSEIKPENPKWPMVLGRINITVGHS